MATHTTTLPDTTTRASARTPGRRPRVLLAAYTSRCPLHALRRAWSLAEAFGWDLYVLGVVPWQGAEAERAGESASQTDRFVAAGQQMRRWCDEVLPSPERGVLVREGMFEVVTARTARDLDVSLIVIPPHEGNSGSRVISLVNRTGMPVLVAQPARSNEVIVAGSDLRDQRLPVVNRAAELGHRLESGLVLVHNTTTAPADLAADEEEAVHSADLARRADRLRTIARQVFPRAETVVSSHASAADAILSTARRRDADLVVVGSRPRSWLDRRPRSGTALHVVSKASRSVLVLPTVMA